MQSAQGRGQPWFCRKHCLLLEAVQVKMKAAFLSGRQEKDEFPSAGMVSRQRGMQRASKGASSAEQPCCSWVAALFQSNK